VMYRSKIGVSGLAFISFNFWEIVVSLIGGLEPK
jgi:hypothetical protein